MPRRLTVLHAVDAEWTGLKTVCLLIRYEDFINEFREIIVAVIARPLHLQLLYRSLTMLLINNRYRLHRPHHPLVIHQIVTSDMESLHWIHRVVR
jgi:RNase adaptor protein for sRNA GlmZ degradation